jgi:hypothetical protein
MRGCAGRSIPEKPVADFNEHIRALEAADAKQDRREVALRAHNQ